MRSEVRVLASSGTARLLEVRLLTGRTHQIRLQVKAAAGPLLGDRLYGDGQGALGLHAHSLSFVHPLTGQEVRCEAPRPPDFPWPPTAEVADR